MGAALSLVAGVALIVAAYLDALATTVVVREGAGPLTRPVTHVIWRALLRLRRSDAGSRSLAAGGGALLFGTVLMWVSMLWAGWTLVFLAGDPAVESSPGGVPAGWVDVAYFAGFTAFTLGVGDFVATSEGWRLAATVASFSGLFLVTLAITYLISVVSAVVAKRALAVHVRGLGSTAQEIVAVGWDGSRFSSSYEQQLIALTSAVATTAEQHLAYPILHSFHGADVETSTALALAELDDGLQLLLVGVARGSRADPSAVLPLRHSIGRYMTTVRASAPASLVDGPPPLGLDGLRALGIPVVGDDEFDHRRDDERRTAMARLVASSGWSWKGPHGQHDAWRCRTDTTE